MAVEVIKYNVAVDDRTWWERVVQGKPHPISYVGPNALDVLGTAARQNAQHSGRWRGRIGAIYFPRKIKPTK